MLVYIELLIFANFIWDYIFYILLFLHISKASPRLTPYCWKGKMGATCKVGDGTTVLFWSDVWNDHLLQHSFPRLFSYAKNNTSQLHNSCWITILRNSFICHFRIKLFKNIMQCSNLSSRPTSQRIQKIVGITFGIILCTQQPNSTICPSRMFTLQTLSSGFGTPAVPIK
jgi:hypothetical protein